jgi:hypothetical protein
MGVNHSYPCLDSSRLRKKRENIRVCDKSERERTCKKLSKRVRGVKMEGWMGRRKLVGD